MKKRLFFMACLALMMILVLPACSAGRGGGGAAPSTAPGNTESSPTPDAPPARPAADASPAANPDLEEIVRLSNILIEALADDLDGIYTVNVEARDRRTLAIVFRAEDAEYEDLDISMQIADEVTPIYSEIPQAMRAIDIDDPIVLVEFLDMDGGLIYSREYNPGSGADLQQPDNSSNVSSEEMLEIYVEMQQVVIPDMEREMGGIATVEIEARGTGTVAYLFRINEFDASAGITESAFKDEMIPEIEASLSFFIPLMQAMGITEEPAIVMEFYGPDGTLLEALEIK